MPQTLLSLLALFSAGILTISQVETQHSTVESVVHDQFELAVAGTLLHAMEFVDSRAFDAATTPARLRARYGLPATMTRAERDTISFDDLIDIRTDEFSEPATFGGADCRVLDPLPATVACDDVDDISGNDWQSVDLETPDGAPLPVEIRVEVDYVESADSDVPVTYRTNHKRVQVFARSNVLRNRAGVVQPMEVSLSRVLSFDTKIAAEYLRRSIAVEGEGGATCEAEVGVWNARMSALRALLDQAVGVRTAASLEVAVARDGLVAAQASQASADAANAEAQAQLAAAQSARNAAAAALATAQSQLASAQATRATRATAVAAAQQNVTTAQTRLAQAQAAVGPAQAAAAAAEAAIGTARTAMNQAEAAMNAAYAVRYNSWGHYFDWLAKRGTYNDRVADYNAAVQAAEAAQATVASAQSAVTSATSGLASAQSALNAAQSALTNADRAVAQAQAAIAPAQSALTAAEAVLATASAAAAQTAAAAAAAAAATATAQAALDRANDVLADAEDDVTDRQRDIDDHQAAYPDCEVSV
jgi:hypothetical protein